MADVTILKVKAEVVENLFEDLNPVLIPSIISEILPYLSNKDVKRSRLVCRLWAEEGTKVLAENGVFHLKGREGVHEFLKHVKNIKSPSKLGSVKKFRIKLSPSTEDGVSTRESSKKVLLETKQSQNLMKEIGKKIKSVILDVHVWRWKKDILWHLLYSEAPNLESLSLCLETSQTIWPDRRSMFRAFPKNDSNIKLLPNIKHLTFIYENQNHLPKAHHSHCLAADLFSRMPNLKKFTCEGDTQCHEDIIRKFFEIKDFHRLNTSFSEFDFNLKLNEEEVTKFHELLKYRLESLKLSLRSGLRFPALYSFLSSLGSTLTTLEIDFIFIPLHAERFPCGQDLVNLKYISFKNYNGPINFIHYTEKLEKLILTNVNLSVAFREESEQDQEFHFDDTPHGLKSLEVFGGHSNAGRFRFPHIFQKMVKLFPKLDSPRFRMDYLTDTSIKIITDGFEYLEELIMENSVCTDEGVTGITSSHFKMLSAKPVNYLADNRRLPCIAMLKRLKILDLYSPMISDRSLRFGIGRCKELKYLSVSSPMITGNALKAVAKSLHLCSLKLVCCYRVTESEIMEIKNILPNGATVIREIL